MSQQWILDPTRNRYYYFSAEEGCYVYQDGERIPLAGTYPAATYPDNTPAYVCRASR